MEAKKENAEALFALIGDLDIRGKALLIEVIAEKMALDFNLKDTPEHHVRQRGFSTNKRLIKKTEKVFTYLLPNE